MLKDLSKIRLLKQRFGFVFIKIVSAIVIFIVFLMLFLIIQKGYNVLSLDFLLKPPQKFMTEGGIFPAIIGTIFLGIGSMVFALPIGVLTAIFLTEYSKKNTFAEVIKTVVNTLSGLPSIVYGLFGFALFSKILGFGISVLSGSLTLGVMSLPLIISTSEESLRSVPNSFREASLSLGATRWTTTIKVILPNALSGIITGTILALGRALGETAPIMFTAATFYTRKLPNSLSSEVMALPYHIYGLVTEGLNPDKQIPIAFGSALVLIIIVILLSSGGVIIRYKTRSGRKW